MVRGGGAIGRIHWSGLGASTAEDLHGNFSGSIGKVVDSGGGGSGRTERGDGQRMVVGVLFILGFGWVR